MGAVWLRPLLSGWLRTGSELTCCGKGDQVLRHEILELLVGVGQRLPQNDLQAPEEGQDVQAVEGEAAGERQQVADGVDGAGRRVGHHVAVHGTVQSGCSQAPTQGRPSMMSHVSEMKKDSSTDVLEGVYLRPAAPARCWDTWF